MFYIRKINGNDEFRPVSPYYGTAWYEQRGWMLYSGNLPQSRVTIEGGTMDADNITRGGTITELPEPEPTEEWVAKRPFVTAITALLTDDVKAALAGDWQTQAWIAKLPGEMVNLLDPEVSAFLIAAGLTLEQVRAEMEV